MLSKYTQKNSFGAYTWHIKLDSLFHIFIHETDNESYIVEFKEWKWINYKKKFSFISNENLEKSIITAFDKVFEYFNNEPNYQWTNEQKEGKLNKVLYLLNK